MAVSRWFCGVDVGLKGGIALLSATDDTIGVYRMPVLTSGGKSVLDLYEIARLINQFNIQLAAVERVGAMPGQGVVSMFNFGQSYGSILGILTALGVPVELVPPKTWQAAILQGFPAELKKKRAIAWAKSRYPDWQKPTDGQADALAIAHYAQTLGKKVKLVDHA